MTYEDAMDEETQVSRTEAIRECERHGHQAAALFEELGDHSEYKARDVLIWLGY